MICKVCGIENPEGSVVCRICGSAFFAGAPGYDVPVSKEEFLATSDKWLSEKEYLEAQQKSKETRLNIPILIAFIIIMIFLPLPFLDISVGFKWGVFIAVCVNSLIIDLIFGSIKAASKNSYLANIKRREDEVYQEYLRNFR